MFSLRSWWHELLLLPGCHDQLSAVACQQEVLVGLADLGLIVDAAREKTPLQEGYKIIIDSLAGL